MNQLRFLCFAMLAVYLFVSPDLSVNANEPSAKELSSKETSAKELKEKHIRDGRARMIKRLYPHGIHKLRTNKKDASIVWQSETLGDDEVVRSTKKYSSLDEFKMALQERALHKEAYIEIIGMWTPSFPTDTDKQTNEAVLRLLRDEGYEEARFANLKKYYSPHGHHFINALRADGKIRWTSSTIAMGRVMYTSREFTSLDAFKTAFLNAKLDKSTRIEVHGRRTTVEAAIVRSAAILEFLSNEGYEKAGPILN